MDNNVLIQFGPLILLVGVMYFFFIRPQVKRQKQQQSFIDSLEKGQEVVTSAGILGRIVKMDEGIITLEVDNKTFLRVTRASISRDMTEGLGKKTE